MSHRALPGDPVPVVTIVHTSKPRVFTRAEIAGLAATEAKINALYGHGDQPSDWYFTRKLAEIDGTLAIQGAA